MGLRERTKDSERGARKTCRGRKSIGETIET